MKSLWGGRMTEKPDAFFASFQSSWSFDRRLAAVDIQGSQAYARALRRANVLDDDELSRLLSGLDALLEDLRHLPAAWQDGLPAHYEDVHAFVEGELFDRVGEVAHKLHTGRSRNDQVATDLRLYLRAELEGLRELVRGLQLALVHQADQKGELPLPGYTHLQRAQPILLGHFLLSYYEMLERDAGRLRDCRARLNQCPLGSGALAGAPYPIDRHALATDLGFDAPCANSLDATSDRDFVVEALAACSLTMVHLSRLCEDLILFSTQEFGFVTLSDRVSTGSSIMPQKKNPDALELIRGKAGRVFGHELAMLTALKGLPSGYNKDLQEDKEALFDTLDTVRSCLLVMTTTLETLEVHPTAMQRALLGGYLNATELADYLAKKGLPFRRAHHLVGEIVQYAAAHHKELHQLSLEEYISFSDQFDATVYQALEISCALQARSTFGGTAPARLKEALQTARKHLEREKNG